MFGNALDGFLVSQKRGNDVKFVQIDPQIAEILIGLFYRDLISTVNLTITVANFEAKY